MRSGGEKRVEGIRYLRADIANGQEPSIAEKLDPNRDGVLRPDEYDADAIVQYGLQRMRFATFARLAKNARTSGFGGVKALMADLVRPGEHVNRSEAGRGEQHRAASMLLAWAERTTDADEALFLLQQAAGLFAEIGHPRSVERCHRLAIERLEQKLGDATAAGETALVATVQSELAAQRAIDAWSRGDIDAVEGFLGGIAPSHPLRGEIETVVTEHHIAHGMSLTFAGVSALAQVAIARMEGTEASRLGGYTHTDYSDRKAALRYLLNEWAVRLVSGQFSDSQGIVADLWASDEVARRALVDLAFPNATQRERQRMTLAHVLEMQHTHFVTIADLLMQEANPNPAVLRGHLHLVAAKADGEGMGQIAAITSVYQEADAFRTAMLAVRDGLFDHRDNFIAVRDALKGQLLDPTTILLPVGAFALSRLTAATLIGRLAPGLTGFGQRAAIFAVEMSCFPGYHRLLTENLTTQPVDWSPEAYAREAATLALCVGLMHVARATIVAPTREQLAMTRTFGVRGAAAPALNRWGQILSRVIDHGGSFSAFAAGGGIAYHIDLREMPPHLLEEWVGFLQFIGGAKLAGAMTGNRIEVRTIHEMNRGARFAALRIGETMANVSRARRSSGAMGTAEAQVKEIATRLYFAKLTQNVSGRELMKLAREMEAGKGDSVDAVIRANEILQRVGVGAAYDGVRLHAATPEQISEYLSELKRQRRRSRHATPPRPAVATAGAARVEVVQTRRAPGLPEAAAMAMQRNGSNGEGEAREVERAVAAASEPMRVLPRWRWRPIVREFKQLTKHRDRMALLAEIAAEIDGAAKPRRNLYKALRKIALQKKFSMRERLEAARLAGKRTLLRKGEVGLLRKIAKRRFGEKPAVQVAALTRLKALGVFRMRQLKRRVIRRMLKHSEPEILLETFRLVRDMPGKRAERTMRKLTAHMEERVRDFMDRMSEEFGSGDAFDETFARERMPADVFLRRKKLNDIFFRMRTDLNIRILAGKATERALERDATRSEREGEVVLIAFVNDTNGIIEHVGDPSRIFGTRRGIPRIPKGLLEVEVYIDEQSGTINTVYGHEVPPFMLDGYRWRPLLKPRARLYDEALHAGRKGKLPARVLEWKHLFNGAMKEAMQSRAQAEPTPRPAAPSPDRPAIAGAETPAEVPQRRSVQKRPRVAETESGAAEELIERFAVGRVDHDPAADDPFLFGESKVREIPDGIVDMSQLGIREATPEPAPGTPSGKPIPLTDVKGPGRAAPKNDPHAATRREARTPQSPDGGPATVRRKAQPFAAGDAPADPQRAKTVFQPAAETMARDLDAVAASAERGERAAAPERGENAPTAVVVNGGARRPTPSEPTAMSAPTRQIDTAGGGGAIAPAIILSRLTPEMIALLNSEGLSEQSFRLKIMTGEITMSFLAARIGELMLAGRVSTGDAEAILATMRGAQSVSRMNAPTKVGPQE